MALRILADENIPGEAIDTLRHLGIDVIWVRTFSPGSSDQAILQQAQAENRLVITFDKDFGELAFHRGLPALSGIILFRISTPGPTYTTSLMVAALQSRSDWAGYFSVVENDRIRMTPLRRGVSDDNISGDNR
jgi:predicted nuclease of predicted toxin-antitoxin system